MTATAMNGSCLRPLSTSGGTERARLTRQEEVELAARAADGDREARDRMVEANSGLVHTIARDFAGRGLELEDLVGEGHHGLFRAVERFDPRHGTRFSTYASHWIKQAIREALMNTAPTIRLPAYMVGLLTRWRRAERALCRELSRRPAFDEVADALGLSAEQREMVRRAQRAGRLRPAGTAGDAGADRALDEVTDRGGRAEERAEGEDDRELLRRRLGRLDERERAIVEWHYGLGCEPLTLKEIGGRLGCTREWARKLERRALAKLGEK